MYSAGFRWRAITLHYAYSIACEQVGRIFGVSGRTVGRWYCEFWPKLPILSGSATHHKSLGNEPTLIIGRK
ncbi:hypothetical protein JG688_00007719 [Phytophthora aleatoria]|uniref:Transposase n=1 Tax=Phytophthora aleatoria TaxID=2496075 RepID=A0A8J5M538_9STRA|nr:hypothetical protein JG688_00007719 [Phytophthora aleatoria]